MAKHKVLPEQHDKIRELFKQGVTIYAIAKMYGVTWGAIQFIVVPEKAEKNRERMRKRQTKLRKGE